MLVRRFRGTRFGGDNARDAEARRLRGRGEPISTELADDAELRRSRSWDNEGKAIVPDDLPALSTGVGNDWFYIKISST